MGNKDNDIQNLRGKILLSTPSISNEYLDKSMVYLCSHDNAGAMGVIINKRVPDINVSSIFKKLKINLRGMENLDIHFGGLEEIDKCFILHSDDYSSPNSILVGHHLALTINGDIIKVITSHGGGPEKKLLCMGCCIWDVEQLENEVASSYWIPIDPDEALIFGDSKADKWSKALLKIGSRTNVFSDLQGNA
ncbi:MAG: YqgE/AlgH family protein [Holosporaceae bacterium]|jgi:putative transcriptional regulator|nr:YqgE/AlgH family protein [Holosporaceae bacterium]